MSVIKTKILTPPLSLPSSQRLGIWTANLRRQTGMEKKLFNQCLKKLERRNIIKAVQSVTASKRKMYMLFNQVPDDSVTGGAWYSGQEFDAQFTSTVRKVGEFSSNVTAARPLLSSRSPSAPSHLPLHPPLSHPPPTA